MTPENITHIDLGAGPVPHVWLGISAEDQGSLDSRWPSVRDTRAAVRFLSLEPLRGPIDLEPILQYPPMADAHKLLMGPREYRGPDWVICGGESGPSARPMHPDWVRSIRDQCMAARVPFCFTQWGEWTPKLQMPESARDIGAWGTLNVHGHWFPLTTPWNGRQGEDSETREYIMVRAGTRAAGRVLDGRTWDEFPSTRA